MINLDSPETSAAQAHEMAFPQADALAKTTRPAPALTVFCGSRHGNDPRFAEEASTFGRWIAAQRWRLVYGGGNVGLMGELARAALQGGGEVLGIIPESLMLREVGLEGISRLEVVSDMSVRKQRLIDEGDVFVVLPGGLGTLDEFFEVATLLQLGYHHKPIILFNRDGFWSPMLGMVRTLIRQGFVAQRECDAWHIVNELEALKALCLQMIPRGSEA